MFKLSPNLTFKWPVKVLEPSPNDPGKLVEYEFGAVLKLVDRDQAAENDRKRQDILARAAKERDPGKLRAIDEELREHARATTAEVVVGWDERLCDENGKPIPFSEANLRAILNYRRVEEAFARAYQEAISEDKARLGN
ncbi:phage tail assembly chaperone [Ensifer sesbaniae]|uniref:phage tail assembly chaperone n=1 Tax=Ensifer sesbaniae TaxID=1214071 RepID=UPI002000BD2F|nr:phage tail assembly chaperone [Ensifer sesbaniae]